MTEAGIRILLADDEPAHLEAIRRALERAELRFEVELAGSLAEFRTQAERRTPDIAVVDLNLPDGRALELLRTPLEDAPFPVLVMTSHGTEQVAVEALKSGALDYLVKSPEAFAGMPRTVARALREWRLLQERKRVEAELRVAKEAAEDASRAKSEFLALMSHELRTPLNAVLGGVQQLLQGEVSCEQQQCLEQIMSSARGQLNLVNDILDLARLESTGPGIEERPFGLRRCLSDTAQLRRAEASDKGLFLEVVVAEELPDRLMGDVLRLRQILHKLLSNAVKFTECGGIRISATLAASGEWGLTVRLAVADSGIGVATEHPELIFAPFVQADMSSTRKYGGSGLGLTLCRRLVEALGGRIWFESNEGQGSVFLFELPLRPEEEADPASAAVAPGRPAPLGPLRVLLADDDPACLKIFPAILAKLGCRVVTAADGGEAVQRFQDAGPFDVILMDIQMPVLSGPQALHAIRELERSQGGRVPVVAQTAYASQKDQRELIAEGFDGYLAKPLDLEELTGMLRHLTAPGGEQAQKKGDGS